MPTDISSVLNQSLGKLSFGEVLIALVTLVVCLLLIRIVTKLLRKVLSRTGLDSRIQKYIRAAVKTLLYVLTVIFVVQNLGIDMTSLVALLSVASLGIALAAEDVLANMAGGLVILSSRPFEIGDFIEVSGTIGTVDSISLNHTKLVTPDGLLVMLPNKTLADSQMTNYTTLGRRRVTQVIRASYDTPTETVKAACLRAVDAVPGVLEDPTPLVYLSKYGDSSIEYTVYCWCGASDYLTIKYALSEQIRTALAQNGVSPPYEHLNLHIVESKD